MTFDGKVGLWPVVETKLAVRNSKNRPKGTPVTTPNEMTDDVYGRMLTQLVIPAIKRVWPGKDKKHLIIQQDNDPPHQGRTEVKKRGGASPPPPFFFFWWRGINIFRGQSFIRTVLHKQRCLASEVSQRSRRSSPRSHVQHHQ
ncbi:hypothetical protein JG687_00015738 [Phytophthora cactorum]|uniref:Uncharacterized protein n=1 Tax=Phytophthora cactorum TaxID=29920 RepID=A0A8T1TSW8_9STRA|nr:hypothetical protein JG687_00015738 [Phytophthora cactorum]